ncbi:restriction endonuclease subunit S [Photobacterium damselae]|nr:restriction endonuclease subunit S [Photobacterium damselae]
MPKLRFPSFNDIWEKHSISDVLEVIERPLKMLDDEKYSLVTVKRRNEGIVRRDFLYGKEIKVKNQFIVKEKDLLISKRQIVHGAIGIVPAQLDGSIVSNEYHAYHTKDGFDLTYFNYLAKRPNLKKSLFLSSDGVDIEKLLFKNNTWFKWQFHFPTLAEQQKIASFLSKIDEKISLLTEKKDKLAEYKKGVMQQLFNGSFQEQNGQLTFIPPTLRFKADDGSEFPDWEEKKLDDICSFTSGKNIKQSEASPEFSTPCVRYGELYHMYGEVITTVVNRTNLEPSELTFSKGDEILLPSAGEDPLDIGAASALTLKDVAIGRTINVLRPKTKDSYCHIYVSYYINNKLKKKISTLARGASISNVYNSDLKGLSILLPSLEEQQVVKSFLVAIEEKIDLTNSELAKAKEWKKGLLQQMFV